MRHVSAFQKTFSLNLSTEVGWVNGSSDTVRLAVNMRHIELDIRTKYDTKQPTRLDSVSSTTHSFFPVKGYTYGLILFLQECVHLFLYLAFNRCLLKSYYPAALQGVRPARPQSYLDLAKKNNVAVSAAARQTVKVALPSPGFHATPTAPMLPTLVECKYQAVASASVFYL